MKVLTIKQPWASLIIDGYKIYEFRSWKTNYRGKIGIHAGLSSENINDFKDYNLIYKKGFIIGEATIVDCILVDEKFNNDLKKIDPKVYKHNLVGQYAWKLENVVKYEEPIEIKGKLGLWNYEKN